MTSCIIKAVMKYCGENKMVFLEISGEKKPYNFFWHQDILNASRIYLDFRDSNSYLNNLFRSIKFIDSIKENNIIDSTISLLKIK